MTSDDDATDTRRAGARRRRTCPADVEGAIYERWLAADVFAPDGAGSRADRDTPPFVIIQPPPNITGALHLGPRADARARGRDGPARPDAGPPDAVAARARPRLDRGPVRPGQDHRRGGRDARVARPRALPRADVAVHQRDARGHARPAAAARRVGRLVPPPVHDGRGLRARRPRALQAPATTTASRTAPRRSINWCPGCRTSVSDLEVIPTPETGTLWTIRYHVIDEATGEPDPDALDRGRHDPARDDPRRHGRRGPPRRRALRGARRSARAHPVRRARRADHRRRGRRSRLRHGRGEDHAGPRPRRLRDRAAARPADDHRARRRRDDQRGG